MPPPAGAGAGGGVVLAARTPAVARAVVTVVAIPAAASARADLARRLVCVLIFDSFSRAYGVSCRARAGPGRRVRHASRSGATAASAADSPHPGPTWPGSGSPARPLMEGTTRQ